MNIIEAVILSIVEGLTEFLPVSSTGHMMIAENLMDMQSSDFLKTFTVSIQLGAILSVVVFYFRRFFDFESENRSGLSGWRLYVLMIFGALPAAVVGLLCEKYIDRLLDSTWVVVVMLFVGGVLMILFDRERYGGRERKIVIPQAVMIGIYQCFAMIPGTSRSMATILGGMQQGLSRKQAAEFSFFLAVPTMLGATFLKLFKSFRDDSVRQQLMDNVNILIIGNVVAFVVALLAIKFFVSFVSRYGFKVFGIYRIVLSVVLGVLMLLNVIPLTLN